MPKPVSDDKYADYLVQKIRQMGSSVTKWALLFLVALLYTWITSIYPRIQMIDDYITVINKRDYFDTLSKHAVRIRKANYTTYLSDSARSDSLIKAAPEGDTQIRLFSGKAQQMLAKANKAKKNFSTLKKLLVMASSQKGEEKRATMAAIKMDYLPTDILFAIAELRKTDAEKQRDSIVNKIGITFNVPQVASINVGFRLGLVIWMFLLLILLAYLFSIRVELAQSLNALYLNRKRALKSNIPQWKKIDLNLPFWIAPVFFRGTEQETYKALFGWNFVFLRNMLGCIFLMTALLMQVHLAWLLWHVSAINDFKSTGVQIAALLNVFATLVIILWWLRPITPSKDFANGDAFSVKRREGIKVAAASIVLLLLIPSVGKTVPLMTGQALNYKRHKRKKNYFAAVKENGFYLHGSKKVLHYFINGYSPSTKTFSKQGNGKPLKKTKKMDIKGIMVTPDALEYHIPHWAFVLEYEAYLYAKKGDYQSGIQILLYALDYAANSKFAMHTAKKVVSTMNVTAQQNRLQHFLTGLVLRAEEKLPTDKQQQIQEAIANNKTSNLINLTIIDHYRSDKIFLKKWQASKVVPWKFSKTLKIT